MTAEENSSLLRSLEQSDLLPDSEALRCRHCDEEFTWLKRRRHCRYCGGTYHDSWVCGGSSAPFFQCLGRRICRNCKVLLQNVDLLADGARFTRWFGRNFKNREECTVHILCQRGIFSLTWQTTPFMRPDNDSTLSLVDVEAGNIHKITQDITLTTPKHLLIRLDGVQNSVMLEARNEFVQKRWYDVCQAACVVSHTVVERLEIRERIRREEREEEDRLSRKRKQQSLADSRHNIAEKYRKRRSYTES